jgi:hypothetical protein
MDDKTADLLDKLITDIRIENQKGNDTNKLDQMLYDLQITIFKQIK